jgi:hypothetical protein
MLDDFRDGGVQPLLGEEAVEIAFPRERAQMRGLSSPGRTRIG